MRRYPRLDNDEETPREPQRFPTFPIILFVTSCVGLIGLYYQLLISIPDQLTRGGLTHLGEGGKDFFSTTTLLFGSFPLLTAILFLGMLAPGLVWPFRARRYYLGLTLGALTLWTLCFTIAGEPAQKFGEAINEMLSMDRNLPEMIQ